jgi:hypothetical protein
MAVNQGNKKILDLKRWEFLSPAPAAAGAAAQISSSYFSRQQQLYVQAATVAYIYTPSEDGWVILPSPAFAGTWAAGASSAGVVWSTGSTIGVASLTATGGSTTTLVTNQTLARDLRGYYVNILSGPNAGETKTIASNTVGVNATITFTTASALPFDATNTYRILAPRWYALGSGTLAAGSFKTYDFATNTWQTLSITGLPATIGTDCKLVATPSWYNGSYCGFGGGTATSATPTTLVDSTKTWAVGQWVGFQVRITGGTGAGQIATITANTATDLTVSAWVIQPDNTSTYTIEGNDDFLWLFGNNAAAIYRYQISTNTWITVTPVVARAAAPGTALSANWVFGVTDSEWTNESAIINGRRIYSFRGGASGALDYYDIPSNSWVSNVAYASNAELLTTGSKYVYNTNYLYIQRDGTGRWLRYSFATSEMEGWSVMNYPQGTAVVGDTAFDVTYFDGASSVTYVHMILNSTVVQLRQMIF